MQSKQRLCVELPRRRSLGIAAALSASLLLSACAGGGRQMAGAGGFLDAQEPMAAAPAMAAGDEKPGSGEKMSSAKAYWADLYAKAPGDEKATLGYVKVLKGEGQKDKARSVLEQATMYNSDNKAIASEYGRLALDMGDVEIARKLLARAEDPKNPDWRLLSAQGTVEAKDNNLDAAQGYYERALALKPEEPSLLNNLALVHALRGDAKGAERLLRQAGANNSNEKVRQNLALVLGVQGRFEEASQIASAELGAETTKANVAFLEDMVAAAPVKAAAAAPATDTMTVAVEKLPVSTPPASLVEAPAGDWSTTTTSVPGTTAAAGEKATTAWRVD